VLRIKTEPGADYPNTAGHASGVGNELPAFGIRRFRRSRHVRGTTALLGGGLLHLPGNVVLKP
jgi:hypothetical protein